MTRKSTPGMLPTPPLEEPFKMSEYVAGRHFLQTPGPTNLPDRVLRAMDHNAINHRGPEFGALGRTVIGKLRARVPDRRGTIGIFPASGTGAWESAMVNTLSRRRPHPARPHRPVLPSVGEMARRSAGCPDVWRPTGAAAPTRTRSARCWPQDREHRIKAVCAVHSETSTSCMTDIAVRARGDGPRPHPALLMVDAISSLGCADYRHDQWGVDVTIAGSQKGLMVPPGLAFTAISEQGPGGRRAPADPGAATGTGSRWSLRTRPASSPTRPRSTCSSR